ncbi:CheR family methyltransferase [Solimonas terrae]|uniref:Protein-glutamate O-methyltransferase CheR n=1 Tax=Solimonas terrae TaxID=1396819 RepID=A0A6M2BU31_9GAMM|nr:CheR family methyltransferase [Solimonas terrae]NGY06116.1 protein-glutamate O-methyltransferase CheR [Solimonas terrae]
MEPAKRQDIEIDLFMRALQQCHGYDFSEYAAASFKRRVQGLLDHFGLANVSQLTERVLHCDDLIPDIIARLSVPVSDMFRDPDVFARLRRDVLPVLASYPHINIWQAGCAHGEEVYSLAILLTEAGLYERTQIYATDISAHALDVAREGIYASRDLQQWAANYLQAGGQRTLSDYFHARYGHIKLDESLRRNVVFAAHNLAADAVFCEAQLILCRNVLIYFRPPLQRRAVALFRDSLVRGGYLCLGTKESLSFTGHAGAFTVVDGSSSLYRLADVDSSSV